MLLKESSKSALIDDYFNEELIEKLEKSNIEKYYYKDEIEEEPIIRNKAYQKIFMNCHNMNISRANVSSIDNLVLRVGVGELKYLDMDSIYQDFNTIVIFSPRKLELDKKKDALKYWFGNLAQYIDKFNGQVDEYISVVNNMPTYNHLYISKDENEAMF